MALNLLPIFLAGGAVVVIASKKKKKKSVTPSVTQIEGLPPLIAPPISQKTAGSSTWKQRQKSLQDAGYDVGSSGIDGIPGKDTRNAIMAFQKDSNILVDGKWGSQTAAAMAQALKMAAQGLGRSAYHTIGNMLSKFLDTLKKFGQGKESEDIGYPPSEIDVIKEQFFALSQIHNNPELNPDLHSLEYVLLQFQMVFGLEPTGTATLETRIKLNEIISGD